MEYRPRGLRSLINDLAQCDASASWRRHDVPFPGGRRSPGRRKAAGVGTVLSGRVTPRGSSLVISVELVDASNGFRLWGARYDRPIADLLAVQEEIAREISSNLKVTLEPEHKKRLAKRYAADREAYPLYLKGRFHWNKSTVPSIRKAIEYFEQAIEKDPAYALAWAGLSDCWAALAMDRFAAVPPREGLPKAKDAARKALEIDDRLAEAHASLAYAEVLDWEWTKAEKEFRRAIKLDPEYALAHRFYGFLLGSLGRFKESIAEYERALALDPLSLIINSDYGWAFYVARRYDEAIDQLRRSIEMDAAFPQTYLWLGLAYHGAGASPNPRRPSPRERG